MVWQTYDYYFDPTAGYFGVKKACEPLHIQYNPSSEKVQIINHSGSNARSLTVSYTLYNKEGERLSGEMKSLDVPADKQVEPFSVSVPQPTDSLAGLPEVFILRLTLNLKDRIVSQNDYILSQEDGVFKALLALPKAQVSVEQILSHGDGEWKGTVTVSNLSDTPAFMVRLNLVDGDGQQVLPVLYSDNYFHLLPHEKRTITVSFADEDVRKGNPKVVVTALTDSEASRQ